MAFENIQISLIAVGSAFIGGMLRPAVSYMLGRMEHKRETTKDETDAGLKAVFHEDERADKARQAVIDRQEARIDKLEEWLAHTVKEYMDCEKRSAALEERVRQCEHLELRVEKFEEWRRRIDRGLGMEADE